MATMREMRPSGVAMAEAEVTLMRGRYEYLIRRRDELLAKLQFGMLTINAASLVALLGALGGKGEAAVWIGLNASHARASACAFTAGIVMAGISIWLDGERFRSEAGDAVARLGSAERVRASYEVDQAVDNGRLDAALDAHGKTAIVDFQYSKPAIVLQNFAGAAWFVGIAVPLANSLGCG